MTLLLWDAAPSRRQATLKVRITHGRGPCRPLCLVASQHSLQEERGARAWPSALSGVGLTQGTQKQLRYAFQSHLRSRFLCVRMRPHEFTDKWSRLPKFRRLPGVRATIVEHTNNKCVHEEKQANSYAHIFLEPNNRVMFLGACVKPQPLNYLPCTAKLRVFTTAPSSERAGNNVASASKATEAHKALCTKKNAGL